MADVSAGRDALIEQALFQIVFQSASLDLLIIPNKLVTVCISIAVIEIATVHSGYNDGMVIGSVSVANKIERADGICPTIGFCCICIGIVFVGRCWLLGVEKQIHSGTPKGMALRRSILGQISNA